VRVKRELEAGWFQWVELPLPAVLTIQSGINKVRYATLKGIMAAKKKEIATIARESLGVEHEPTQRIERIYVPTKTKKTEFITARRRKPPRSCSKIEARSAGVVTVARVRAPRAVAIALASRSPRCFGGRVARRRHGARL